MLKRKGVIKRALAILLILTMCVALGACGHKEEANTPDSPDVKKEHIDIAAAAGNPNAIFYSLVTAMSEIIMSEYDYITITPKPTGSAATPEGIQSGELLAGICQTAASADAIAGKEPYSEPTDKVMQIFTFTPMPIHVILRKDAGVQSMKDLKGKSVVPLNPGSAGYKACSELLQLNDMTFDDFRQAHYVTGADGINLLKNRQADALFIANTPPISYVTDLGTAQTPDLMDFSEEDIKRFCETFPGYNPCVIPAGTYKDIDRDIHSPGPMNTFVVSADLDEDVVYDIVKAICENRSKLGDTIAGLKGITVEQLATVSDTPMHPGAIKYYKEIGVME